jgi:putative membrane protein
MIDKLDWLSVYPEIVLLVMGCVITLVDLWVKTALRSLTYGLTLGTLLLVAVVMLVVFKGQFPTGAATWFLVALVVFMAASIQFYARWRRLRGERLAAEGSRDGTTGGTDGAAA